jgi:hypothetical protein
MDEQTQASQAETETISKGFSFELNGEPFTIVASGLQLEVFKLLYRWEGVRVSVQEHILVPQGSMHSSISQLRKKLRDQKIPLEIFSARGGRYRLARTPES